jgi:hypothetical protein
MVLEINLFWIFFSDKGVDNSLVPMYSLFMIFWSVLFLKNWKRKQISLVYKWEDQSVIDPHQVIHEEMEEEIIRQDYYGDEVRNIQLPIH